MHEKYLWKMVATLGAWVVLGIISTVAIVNAEALGEDASVIAGVPLAIGVMITGIIWMGEAAIEASMERRRMEHGQPSQETVEKSKREAGMSKMELLLEMMDDDERAAFKETLKQQMLGEKRLNSDGELNVDAAFFEEDDAFNRSR